MYPPQSTAPAAVAPVKADRSWWIRLVPLPCPPSRVLQNATIHQGHPPHGHHLRWSDGDSRPTEVTLLLHVKRGVLLFQLRRLPSPSLPSSLRSWRATRHGQQQRPRVGWYCLGQGVGGWYGFCWVLGGHDCPANMRQTVSKAELAVQVRSVALL